MRILITGGTGYIGSGLAARFVKKNDVRILTRRDVLSFGNAPYEFVQGDVTDSAAVRSAAKGVDVIFHLAASKDHAIGYKDIKKTNVAGTKNILDAAVANGVEKVVYASSVAAVEKIRLGYSQSKAASEKLAEIYTHKLCIPVLRLAPVYDSSRLKFTKTYFPMPDIELQLHLAYKKSVIDAMYGAWKYGKSKIYTVADKKPVAAKKLYEVICSFYGRRPLYVPKELIDAGLAFVSAYEMTARTFGIKPSVTRSMLEAFLQNRSYDISLAKKELKYKPADTIKTVRKCLGDFKC